MHVHEKPILKKIFSFGLTYTIYLKEPETEKVGKETHVDTCSNMSFLCLTCFWIPTWQVTTAYLEDEVEEDQRRKTFTSLQWGKQYCVSMTVEGNGGILTSAVSPKQCLLLPDRGENTHTYEGNKPYTHFHQLRLTSLHCNIPLRVQTYVIAVIQL